MDAAAGRKSLLMFKERARARLRFPSDGWKGVLSLEREEEG